MNEKMLKLAEEKGWNYISSNQKLSEEFIEKYEDKVNWVYISQYQKLSEEFMEKYIDRLYLNLMGNYIKRESCYWCNNKLNIIKINNKEINYCSKCLR